MSSGAPSSGVSVAALRFPASLARPVSGRFYGILSTYPPTPCGLATFSAALARGLEGNGASVGVVRIADQVRSSDPRVLAELENGSPASVAEATADLTIGFLVYCAGADPDFPLGDRAILEVHWN